MGDVLSLIEKAEQQYDAKKAAELEEKIRASEFTLDDFMDQFRQIKNLGSMEQIMGMLPGMNTAAMKDVKFDERALDRTEAIIKSMTPLERRKPNIIDMSRKRRIALGSGNSVDDVNRLLKQFEQIKKLMKQMTGGNMGAMQGMMPGFNRSKSRGKSKNRRRFRR